MPATPPPRPADPAPGLVATPSADRPAVLLAVAQAVAAHADLGALLRDLAAALRGHLRCGYISFALVDPDARSARLQFLEPVGDAPRPDPADTPTALPAGESPTALVWGTQQPLWLDVDDHTTAGFPVLRAAFARQGVRAAAFVPLTTPRRKLGAMGFNSYQPVAPAAGDLDFASQIGRLVALAVEGALTRRELEESNRRLTRERDRLGLLSEVGQAVTARLDVPGLLRAVAAGLRKVVDLRYTALVLPDPDGKRLRVPAADYAGDEPLTIEEAVFPLDGSPSGEAFRTGRPVRLGPAELGRLESAQAKWAVDQGGRSFCAVPLWCGGSVVGLLSLLGRRPDTFSDDTVELLEAVARPIAVAVANAQAYRRIEELTARLAAEKTYLEEEIRSEWGVDELVGGPLLKEVLRQVEVVAPTASTVLITGETGTGKELIARAVHRLSNRKDRTFVKLNCAAIPTGLLESELFGHEKGAFTGAVERRIGRFELADGGTLFLDEVGDIPAELQPKLLRVLQEQEFERLGSGKTIKVDVRLVAATHRNLAELVAQGKYRQDLFYRLHVFPLRLPPLRDRRDDVPGLVRHFVRLFARRLGKRIDHIPSDAMAALQRYPWPGNIRELEHLVERAVILSPGPELRVPLAELSAVAPLLSGPATEPTAAKPTGRPTLRDTERDAIRQAVSECNGVIGGPNGAAARLGLKRTTLISRMKKLGLEVR